MPTESPRRILILGAGPAAHRLVEALQARGCAETPNWLITVVGEETHLPYDRVQLSKRLGGAVDLTLGDRSLWDSDQVTFLGSRRAVALDTQTRTVAIDDGSMLAYDELVLATGSSATVPPIAGAAAGRVYRTIDDVDALAAEIQALRTKLSREPQVIVVGGGLLGLEAAGGATGLGARATVVHSGKWLMSNQLDEGAGQALGRLICAKGISLVLGVRPSAILTDPQGTVTGVALADGRTLDADVVVFSIGITARDELPREAGLEMAPRGGVLVDDSCATSAPHVRAIGEVAAFAGRPVGLVAPANAMAEVVADRLLGGLATYPGPDEATKLKLSGVDVASFGDAGASSEGALEVVYSDPSRGLYQKVVVGDDAKTLLGGIFVGDASPYLALRPMLGRELPGEPGAYLAAAGAETPDAGELPDDAQVCSCNNVSAGTLRHHIAEGCTELGELKQCSRAGTQCGSCLPLVKKILDQELTKAGVTVSHALCEHVSMSRAELFESVRVLGLQTIREVQSRFVKGGIGCDICKPVVASIIATQTSGYILDEGAGPLQDTNDRALANMQKDGTYSVVPRIPGGEITPGKLAVIAQIAQDFGLYTKITGGQRIDLFGARLEQLTDIWKRLIDAGMESGQAYGKSLRTVKSCVGSSWCRYGIQDSTELAVRLELRYRGLRSPHKLKLGVSGCGRECAEARSKDVGVVATEKGWNLYVGGNGGFQPAHAQLLVQDVDTETLIRYIDRYMMYYIRTADKLQRTARWQEELPGGLDHVREVVCEDSLGIAADLEAAMAHHVESYEDEWAATLDDPERLRRFRSFVNAPEAADPTVLRVPDGRGQSRPATPGERILIASSTIPVRDA